MAATTDDGAWEVALAAAPPASAAVDPTLADLLPAPAAPPATRRGVPVWTTVKTDSERHVERLEARLARVQAASAGRGRGRGRGRGQGAGRDATPTHAAVRPLTEVELLALDDGYGDWRAREDHEDDVAMLARLAEARGYHPDPADPGEDEAVPARVTRYAALLAAGRGRSSSSGSSSGSSHGDAPLPADTDAAWTRDWPPLDAPDAPVQPPAPL